MAQPISTKLLLPGLSLFVFETPEQASVWVADQMVPLINSSKPPVLGLATGSTPIKLYAELIKRYKEGQISFKRTTTFNLDEYAIEHSHPLSYHSFMDTNLFNHVDIPRESINVPNGSLLLKENNDQEVEEHCKSYELKIASHGGLDLQILGIGRTGHIGFNEPGSDEKTKTRKIEIHTVTRQDAIREFGSIDLVPKTSITMGVSTILGAKRVILLAFGSSKAPIISQLLSEERLTTPSPQIPASYLFGHSNVQIVLDRQAAEQLEKE